MNRDLSGEDHRAKPSGSTNISDGGNEVSHRLRVQGSNRRSRVGPPEDEHSIPDFIVKVKVESEFEFGDVWASQVKGEVNQLKTENLQSDSFQTFREFLTKDHVKREPCESPPQEPNSSVKLLEKKQTKMVPCLNCSKFSTEDKFNVHVTETFCHDVEKVNCVLHNSYKKCTETLKQMKINEKTHKCSLCNQTFTLSSSLKLHQKMHTGEKTYTCHVCRETFSRMLPLKRHERMHTAEKESMIKKEDCNPKRKPTKDNKQRKNPRDCSIYNKASTDRPTLRRHKKIHTGEKPYTCSVCHKPFKDRTTLRRHQHIHTGEKPYKCTVCHKAFTDRTTSRRHQIMHTGEKPYNCTVCCKTFPRLSHLIGHKRIHTGEKPYTCSVCHKAFTDRSTLTRHQQVHTGEKPYKCTVCCKAFSQFAYHKMVHTGERPHKCSVCNKAFARASHLFRHKKIHTGEKPYKCSVCHKAFTRLETLSNHQRKHTKEDKNKQISHHGPSNVSTLPPQKD